MRGEPALALEAARRVMAAGVRPDPVFTWGAEAFWSYVEADALDELEELDRRQGSKSFELPALGGRLREAVRRYDA